MAIVLEGFDNSGKSTLARAFPFPIVHPGPRPKNEEEERRCLDRQMFMANQRLVLDRVTSISTPCYTTRIEPYITYASMLSKVQHCVIIYCRPPLEVVKDFSRHVCKGYDEASKIQWLIDNAEAIVANYDLYMSFLPHRKYDYTNPDRSVIDDAIEAQHSVRGWQEWLTKTGVGRI